MIPFIQRLFFVSCIFMCKFAYSFELTDPRKVCPPPDLIEPCICNQDAKEKYDDLMCDESDTVETLTGVLLKTNDYEFGSIILTGSRLPYIPSKLVCIKGLKAIHIIRTTLGSFFEELPPENNTVEYVGLAMTEQTDLMDWQYFSIFGNLKSVFFFFTPGLKFDQNFTENMPQSLVKLKVRECATRRIEDGAFARLNNLEDIFFQKEMIRELKRNMFSTPAKLHTFDFRENQLTSLPDNLFEDMPDLREIYLSENHLTSIDQNVFHNILPQLVVLDIRNNPINCQGDLLWITQSKSHSSRLLAPCLEPANLTEMASVDLVPADFSH